MEERESNERKNLFIRTVIIIILLLLAFLSTILYVYLYPKTRVYLYDTDYTPIRSFAVKKYSTLSSLPDMEKSGYTFKYWTYDDFELNGGTILDKDAELTTDVLNLYANYQANSYRVKYHVQYFDENLGTYMYKTYIPPRNTYPEIYEYGTKIPSLPTGRDSFNNLLPDFNNKPGYHFVGWTTKVVSEDDPTAKDYLKYAGQEYVIDIPSDIDFYAYFEKNQYDVNLHTGIEYQLDSSNNPLKDSTGEYIIKNITGDTNNDRESVIKDRVRYMDSLVEFVDKGYSDITLNEVNAGMAYGEYEFKGWFLDEDYTLPIDSAMQLDLKIKANGQPYYEYKLANGTTIEILGKDTGDRDSDDNVLYSFDIYSKWQRKSYEITFNKNSNSSNGKIAPIHLFKVFLDENGVIIDEYGKYYNDGEFTYSGYENGGHYSKVNLETLDVVSQAFRDSNRNYRLVAWTDNTNTKSEDTKWYALWQQEPWTETLGMNRQTGTISYSNSVYVHTISDVATLFAQWSKVYIIKFAYAQGSNQKYFEYSGIEGEWFMLPNMADITRITGSEWTKKYNYFAGWTTGTSSLATRYLEKSATGEINPEFKYTIGRASATLIVYWLKTPYTVKFHLNDNDELSSGGAVFETYAPVYGGTYKYYPKSPTREGYIFDGWSKVDYKTNEYSTLKRKVRDNIALSEAETNRYGQAYTSSSNFLIDGDAIYYASWTTNFEVEYDANGGTFAGNAVTSYKYSELSSGNLKINLYVGSGLKSIVKENYIFKGWRIKISDGVVGDKLIKTSDTQKTTFDFLNIDGKYYYYNYKADGVTVADSEKTEMALQEGRKVVLVAEWEAKKYNVTIKDTMASGDKTATQITITIAFNEDFTFPSENALGHPFDSKIGYKLIGFSSTDGGEVKYAIVDGVYPVIPANTIDRNLTFYTVYEKKTITVLFKAKMPDGSVVDFDNSYTKDVDYGAVISLPVIPTIEYRGKVLKFKYWYYEVVENDGTREVQITSGDKVIYHDADNQLIIYGHFEAESYDITIGITNPYNNASLIVSTIALDPQEKDSQITDVLYQEVMDKVHASLQELLKDYLIEGASSDIYKGYTLVGLYSTGGYDDKFEVGKLFNSTNFRILGFTTSGMTLATRWNANEVDIVYNAEEGEGGDKKTDKIVFSTIPVTLKDSSFVTVTGGQIIKSWYILDGSNKLFFDCSSILAGVGSKYGYSNLNALQKFITWDNSGKGTINLYANVAQTCNIEYYTFNGNAIENVKTQSFIFGEDINLELGDIAITGLFADKDMKFEGWYLSNSIKFVGGQSMSAVRDYLNAGNNYTIKLYANLTFIKSVYIVKVGGGITQEELYSTETIGILNFNEAGEVFYINAITLKSYPEVSSDMLPEGYTYYGLRFGENTYKKEEISGTGISIPVSGNNITLYTYYTQEYTITYKVIEGATFEDGTTEDRVETYLIGLDKVVVGGNITIKYGAKKAGYEGCFEGWQVRADNGSLGNVKYLLNAIFFPTERNVTLVPSFKTPEGGTIDAVIVLIKEKGSDDSKTFAYLTSDNKPSENQTEKHITNGYTFTFLGGDSYNWVNLSKDLYKWVDEDGNEYAVGDTFTIPVAISSGQTFTFTGVWVEKYIVNFNQPVEYESAVNYTPQRTLYRGQEYKLEEKPQIFVDGVEVEGVEFKYWTYDDNGTARIIKLGDTIVLNKEGETGYKYVGNADGSGIHYLPAPEGNNVYTLLGAWSYVTYSVTLIVTSSGTDYRLVLANVPFGTIIGNREMLNSTYAYLQNADESITNTNISNINYILNTLETDSRGIVGWSKTKDSTTADADVLNGIKDNLTLYAVWQDKYTLSFANANDTFGYNMAIADSKHLPSETIDVNDVIKYIYAKGYSTVYLEDGKWIIINSSENDYYYFVSGFRASRTLSTVSGEVTELLVDGNGRVPAFTMPVGDVTLTPVISPIYKVSFYDNIDQDGGNLVLNNEGVEKYIKFIRSGESLELNSNYTTSRINFTFNGWNTDKDSDSTITSITAVDKNINLYAIWASNRRIKFQVSLSSANGITNRNMLEMPLTKDNKVNADILNKYLNGEEITLENVVVYGNLDKVVSLMNLGHQAYSYNFNNYLLEGYIVYPKSGASTTLTLDDLLRENFGSDNYNVTEDVVVTFNLIDIFQIVYNANSSDVEGDINSIDYFVATASKTGKLVEKTISNPDGIDSSFKLPNPTVTRKHFTASMWASDAVLSNSTIRYNLSSAEDLLLNSSKLNSIATMLRNKYTQIYNLYIIWEYELIDTYVYAVADVIDSEQEGNADLPETTLVSPYKAYLLGGIDGANIGFANIPNIITIGGNRIISVGNYAYNKTNPSIAQVRYNSTIVLNRNNLNLTIGGYTLVGFSTTLYKLGESVAEDKYYAFGSEIIVDDNLIKSRVIKLYPVYTYATKDITVNTAFGGVTVRENFQLKNSDGDILTNATAGYIYIDNMHSVESVITSEENSKVFTVNHFTTLEIIADKPDSGYGFDKFDSNITDAGFITIDETHAYIGTADMSYLFNATNNGLDRYYIVTTYSADKVKVNINLNYGLYTLKDGFTDNGSITIGGVTDSLNYEAYTLDRANLNALIKVTSISQLSYSLDNRSDYYDFVLYSGDKVITLSQGRMIDVSQLEMSATRDGEGYYEADITIVATPKSYTVTFVMNRGTLQNVAMSATSAIYNNVDKFDIVNRSAVVFMGSEITLPTKEDITYTKGKFVKFYLNGDETKSAITKYIISKDTTFVEDFDDNAYTIQYNYKGRVTYVSGFEPNSLVTIGVEEARNIDGFSLEYWTYENGEKAFDDGEKITITKSYILYGYYSGNKITYKYTYTGGEKTVEGENGQDITLLDPSTLTDATHADNLYISGWKYNGKTFTAPSKITFAELGYIYDANNSTIVFEAVYLGRYTYTIEYVTTGLKDGDLSNASEFSSTTHYVRKSNSTDGYYLSDLKVKISEITPLYDAGKSLYFDKYTIEYSIDNRSSWRTTTDEIRVGGTLTLVEPIDNVNIIYRLTPTFVSTYSTITIDYTLTNPTDNSSLQDTITADGNSVSSYITNREFNTGKAFSDDYLLSIASVMGSSTASFSISGDSVGFELTIEGIDWFEYTLLGYKITLYRTLDDTNPVTRQFLFGQSANEDRSIAGFAKAKLTSIWEQKYVIYYYNQSNTLLKKDYHEFDESISAIATLNKDIASSENFYLNGYAFVGWTTISGNNHVVNSVDEFVTFASEIEVQNGNRRVFLYPAQAKIYTLKFITEGVDSEDSTNFVFGSYSTPTIHLGINDSNSINLANYMLSAGNYFDYSDLSKLYTSYDSTKYTFKGFASSTDGEPNTTYTFDSSAINGNNINAYVIWRKNSYNITFTFEAYDNSGDNTNLLANYIFEINKYYADNMNFAWSYDASTNHFDILADTENNGNWISDIKNSDGVCLEEKINSILSNEGIDYLSAIKFVHEVGSSEAELDVSNPYMVTSNDTIRVIFVTPVYRLSYRVYGDAKYQGNEVKNNELYSEIISLGSVVTPKINISDIEVAGYNIDYWASTGDTNFFAGGSHTIGSSDIEASKVTSEYRLIISPHYSTAYELNFYYFASLEDLKNYEMAVENGDNNANDYYTKLGDTINVSLNDTIGLYETDSDGNVIYDEYSPRKKYLDAAKTIRATIFDSYLQSNVVEVVVDKNNNSKTRINSLQDLFTVFANYEYVTNGEIRVNNDEKTYMVFDLDDGNYYTNSYSVKTYGTGNALVNNIYLKYEILSHEVSFVSAVVVENEDAEGNTSLVFDEYVSSIYNVFGEYALNSEQLNDTGDINYEGETRGLANTINSNDISNGIVTYRNSIYLMNRPFYVRAATNVSNSFIFQGWKILTSSNELVDLADSGLELSEVVDGDSGQIKYWQVRNVTKDIKFVSVYTQNFIEVVVNLTSEDGVGDQLLLSLMSFYSNLYADYSEDTANITVNESTHTTTYNIAVLYNSWLSIDVHEDLKASYKIKTVRVGSFETSGSISIGVDDSNIINNKIVINVEYAQLSYDMLLKIDQTIDGTRYSGQLDKVNYSIGEINSSSELAYTGNEFGYSADLPVGATLSGNTLGVPTLNNYTFTKWQYRDNAGNWIDLTTIDAVDIADYFNQVYVRAIFEANTINVEYVVETNYDGNKVTQEITDLRTTVTYGNSLTLPYVFIETDNYITTGFDLGNFGSKITVVASNNEVMDVLVIKATYTDIKHVVFSAGDTGFTIPSDYPVDKSTLNKIVESPIVVHSGTSYYYNKCDSNSLTAGTIKMASQETTIKGNSYVIPSATIAPIDGVQFEGFVSKMSKSYSYGDTYTYTSGDEENGLITLTAVASTSINVKFYVTNPSDNSLATFATKIEDGIPFDIEYINLRIDKDSNYKYVDIDVDGSNTKYIKFNAMTSSNIDVAYFMQSSDVDNYKFYGWSTEKINTFTNILNLYNSSDNYDNGGYKYLSYYTLDSGICSKKAYQVITRELSEFIRNNNAQTLYAIWEQKYTVSFVDDDEILRASNKYGFGEAITFPSPSDFTLTNDTQKWIGWQSGDSRVEFVDGKAMAYMSVASAQTWRPLWQNGYTITLNTNFDRDRVSAIFAKYGQTQSNIKNSLGYPMIIDDNSLFKASGEIVTIGGKTYSSTYTYNELLLDNQKISLSSISMTDCIMDSDGNATTIYPTNLTLSNATWLNSYYTFAGWSYTPDGEVIAYDKLSAIGVQNNSNTTLYAIWNACEFDMTFCASQEDAGKGVSIDPTSVITVRFGETFNIEDYEKEEFIRNYSELYNKPGYRFREWKVIAPLTNAILRSGGLNIINNQYLYPVFDEAYTVIFKSTKDQIIAGQGDDLENCQKVINGEYVAIRDYIINTLGQDISQVKELYYTNNLAVKTNISKDTDKILFDSSKISGNDQTNKTFTIYIDVSFSINLYVPKIDTGNSNYNLYKNIDVAPDSIITVKSSSAYSEEYTLDTSVYSGNPNFVGWYFYPRVTEDVSNDKYLSRVTGTEVFRVDDLNNAIVRFKVTIEKTMSGGIEVSKYILITYTADGTEITYDLSSNGLSINFFAKLTVKQTITLGSSEDKLIQKYAQLSAISSNYLLIDNTETIDNTSTGNRDVKTYTITTAYKSSKEITFTIETEGYIIDKVNTTDNALVGYTPDNSNLVNEYSLLDRNNRYILNLNKSTTTSKIINGNTVNGMFIIYTFTLEAIIVNNYTFSFEITPYTTNVEYKINADDGKFLTSSNNDFATSGAIGMLAGTNIYGNSSNKAYESNNITISYNYTTTNGYNVLTFSSVPYGARLNFEYVPNEIMHKHFDSIKFAWDSNVWKVDGNNNIGYTSISVDSSGKSITYTPVEYTGSNKTASFNTIYEIEVVFVANKIEKVELYLDFENSDPVNNTTWIKALNKTIDGHEIKTTKFANPTTQIEYTRYYIYWEIGAENISAGTDLTNKFSEWKNNFHTDFENKLASGNPGQAQIDLGVLLNYFWLDDNSNFQTYSKYKSEQSSNGYLEGNTIYSLNNGTVQLHIDLTKAMIISASTRTMDYLNTNEVLIDSNGLDVQRATISVERDNASNTLVYGRDNVKIDYTDNTLESNLLLKARFDNNNLTFTTTPNSADGSHVEYVMSKWSAIDGGSISDGITSNTLKLGSNNANNNIKDMFAEFGTADVHKLPEIHLRGDFVAKTFAINFYNAESDGNYPLIATFDVAYDENIANITDKDTGAYKYLHYNYSIQSMRALNSLHPAPRFKLDTNNDNGSAKFVHPIDDMSNIYGELHYLFKYWALSVGGSAYNATWALVNKTVNEYNAVNLYANYESALMIRFIKFDGSSEVECPLYLASTNFVDQFGIKYDTSLLSKDYAVNSTWLSSNANATKDANGNYEFYLRGINNITNIKVSTLQDIENAYKNDGNNLAEKDMYILYPKMEIILTVYKHMTDVGYSSETAEYYTLGGKLVFAQEIITSNSGYEATNNLALSNIILGANEEALSTLAPADRYPVDYTFSMWYVGNNNSYLGTIVNNNLQQSNLSKLISDWLNSAEHTSVTTENGKLISNNIEITSDANVYPHFNAKVIVSTSAWGNLLITSGDGSTYSAGEQFSLFRSIPSFKYITPISYDENARMHLGIWYETLAKDSNGFTYAVFKIVDRTNNTTLYTINYKANQTIFDKIAMNITTKNGISRILSGAGSLDSSNSYMDIEDAYGAITLAPTAYPANVTLSTSQFVITNIPEPLKYSNTIKYNVSSLNIEGGAEFIFDTKSSESEMNWKISFKSIINGEMDSKNYVTATAQAPFFTNKLNEYLTNFRWQYSTDNGKTWNDCPDNMSALGSYPIRLAAEWKTFNVEFIRMKDTSSSITKVDTEGGEWKIKDKTYDGYKINGKTYESYLLYKGEILKYNESNLSFVFDGSPLGRSGIVAQITNNNGYAQGWLLRPTSTKVAKIDDQSTYDYQENDYAFVAWVEAKKTIDVNVDTNDGTGYTKTDGIMPGYGNVEYSISNPLVNGTTSEMSNLAINKKNKTYGSIIVGASTKVTFKFSENQNTNHNLVGITWKTGNPSIKVNAEASDYTISEYGDDLLRYVQVLFDATPTQSTYNLAYRNNKFVTYNGSADNAMYTIYGGYTIEYSLASNVLTAKIYSYWYDKSTNNISAVNTFTVALKENKTNAKDKYYPRDNYYIRDLKIFEVDTITTTNNIIDNNLDMNSGTSIINGNTITVRSTSYDGNKKVYVVKFDEYIHAVDLSYNITYAGSTSTSLSTDLAYIEAEKIDGNAVTQNITGAITTINNISNNEATGYIQYDMIKGGIYLSISDRFAGTIVPSNSKEYSYKLKSVSIAGKTVTYPTSTSSVTGAQESFDIEEASYTVDIVLTVSNAVNVLFKLTLPRAEDLRNLRISYTSNINGYVPTFNSDTATVAIPVNSTVTISNNGKTLEIFDGKTGSLLLRYVITSGDSIYTFDGWYVDSNYTHSLMEENVTRTIGGYSYNLIGFDSNTKITDTTKLTRDCAIVLSMDRSEIKIYQDNTTWYNLIKYDNSNDRIESNTDDIDFLLNKLQGTKFSSSATYTVPGGLIELMPLGIGDTLHHSRGGDNTGNYVGINSSTSRPLNIGNRWQAMNSRGDVFTLTIDANSPRKLSLGQSTQSYDNLPEYVVLRAGSKGVETANNYDVELTQGNEWVLVEYPAITANNTVTVTFTEYEDGSGNQYVLDMLKSDHDLYTGEITNQITSLYSEKYSTSRLYENLASCPRSYFANVYSDYGKEYYSPTSVTFNAGNTWTNRGSGSKVSLTGYKVYTNSSVLANNVKTLNLASYSQDVIKVSPIFAETKQYKVTFINSSRYFGSQAKTYYVMDGDTYSFSYNLTGISMVTSSSGTTSTVYVPTDGTYTPGNGDYVLNGLWFKGTFTNAEFNGKFSNAYFYNSTYNLYTIASSYVSPSSSQLNIKFVPTGDVEIWPLTVKLNQHIVYGKCTNYRSFRNLPINEAQVCGSYNFVPTGLKLDAREMLKNINLGSVVSRYFTVNNDAKWETENEVFTYSLTHNRHAMFFTNKLNWLACIQYQEAQCSYCGAIDPYYGETGGSRHTWKYGPWERKDDNKHIRSGYCTSCNKPTSEVSQHSYDVNKPLYQFVANNQHYKYYECTICGGQANRSSLENCNIKRIFSYYDSEQHRITPECTLCKNQGADSYGTHYQSNSALIEDIAGTCGGYNQEKFKCMFCKEQIIRNVGDKLEHTFEYLMKITKRRPTNNRNNTFEQYSLRDEYEISTLALQNPNQQIINDGGSGTPYSMPSCSHIATCTRCGYSREESCTMLLTLPTCGKEGRWTCKYNCGFYQNVKATGEHKYHYTLAIPRPYMTSEATCHAPSLSVFVYDYNPVTRKYTRKDLYCAKWKEECIDCGKSRIYDYPPKDHTPDEYRVSDADINKIRDVAAGAIFVALSLNYPPAALTAAILDTMLPHVRAEVTTCKDCHSETFTRVTIRRDGGWVGSLATWIIKKFDPNFELPEKYEYIGEWRWNKKLK